MGAHGSVRRADPLDREIRPRLAAAEAGRTGPRARLPGLRHAAGDDRQGARHRAARPDVIFCSFGDMLRVPGSRDRPAHSQVARRGRARGLFAAGLPEDRAGESGQEGGLLRHRLRDHGARQRHVGLAGARSRACATSPILVSHVLVPPAMEAILRSPENRVQGFLGPGHVCAVMGYRRIRADRGEVPRADRRHGLRAAGHAARHAHGPAPTRSRQGGGGEPIPARRQTRRQPRRAGAGQQGLRGVRPQVARRGCHPQERLSPAGASSATTTPSTCSRSAGIKTQESPICISGLVLRGVKKPHDCPAFGKDCTPEHPLGATMVSAEGACAAYYTYGRHCSRRKRRLRRRRNRQ